uniref:TRUD domain-containing protein n=1 Tax=Angiostrongylus cantonensis TaxID=6313 RepID=A0A0K0DK92_ANGCA
MEVDFGISSYLGDRKTTIPCVMKELYSDFIVREVLADQSVLRLVTASEVKKYVMDEEDKAVDESVSVPSVVSADQISALDGLTKTSTPLKISCEKLSKDDRKAFHEFVRLRYQGKLSSETKNNTFLVNSSTLPRKRKRWDQHCPDYCHFTLAKENKDTSYALGVIAKFLRLNFRTHGIKDRRAITCQRVSCNRVEKERILSLNTHLRDIVVYDAKYEHDELKMGGHWGNRFHIILRNIPLESRNILEDRLQEFVLHGFINYFGTQRFGTCGTNTAAIGRKILQRDWEGAIKLILSNDQMNGYLGSVGDASRCWKETGDASVALKKLKGSQAYASIEAIIFKCLAKGGTWQKVVFSIMLNSVQCLSSVMGPYMTPQIRMFQCITEALPINLRSLYVHAYQSLLWNKVVSRRISENGAVVCTDDLGSDGKKLPSDASLFDIYIPLPGENVNFERNYVSNWYEELLTKDGLSFSSFSTLEDRFALGETTRAMLISPKDVRWKFIQYTNPRAYLQDGLSTQAIDDSEMVGNLMAVQIEFSLSSGCYATIALRQITGTDMALDHFDRGDREIHFEKYFEFTVRLCMNDLY